MPDRGARTDIRQRRAWQTQGADPLGDGVLQRVAFFMGPSGSRSVAATDIDTEIAADEGSIIVADGQGGSQVQDMAGTSFPTSPYTGQTFYRTDLFEWYTYDGGDWVGELRQTHFNSNTATLFPTPGTVNLRPHFGMTVASPYGYPVPYNTKLVQLVISSDQAVTGDVEVEFGTSTVVSESLSAETVASFDLDVDLASSTTDGLRVVFQLTSGNFEDVFVILFMRRRFDAS